MKKFLVYNFQFSKVFTLVEILTAVSILAIIGTICLGVITITLRTTKKSDVMQVARQESDTALTQMVKNIRYAQNITDPASCIPTTTVSSITITSVTTHLPSTYACTSNSITYNGTSLFNTNAVKVSACSFVCTQASVNDPPTVTIQYSLVPATTGLFVETNFTMPFQSSVTLRNAQIPY